MNRVPTDARLMRLAIALGSRDLGLTWPNPAVGAVIVTQDGRILSQGATQPGGRPHAEVVALATAGAAARGATLYVSLEPCSHHGRTPPCAEAIVASGIGRVVSALKDPDGRVAGRGYDILTAAGLDLATGIEAEAAARAHRGHVMRVTEGRPWLTLKLAQTRDGIAGRRLGPRLLITGQGADARTHMVRARADAIMVGVGTVEADDPRLDVRLPGLETRRPVRIVIDSLLRTRRTTRLAASARLQPTWIVCTHAAPLGRGSALTEHGIDIVRVAGDLAGRVDLAAAMRELASRGLTRIVCEGGPALADALAALDLVDDIVLISGGGTPEGVIDDDAVPALGPALVGSLDRRFSRVSRDEVGRDFIETFERTQPCSPAL